MKQSDYFFSENATINEGITTGKITNAAIYFTKDYFYIIPFDSLAVVGGGTLTTHATTETFTNSAEFLVFIQSNITQLSDLEFHKHMTDFLPEDRIIKISSLNKFSIKTGWLTAGIKFKKYEGSLKTMSVKPKEILASLKDFYAV